MSLAQSPFKNRNRQFTSATSTTAFSPPIGWIQVISAGDVVVKDEAGTACTFTSCAAGDVLIGPFSEFTSTTSAKVRLGDGPPPSAANVYAPGTLAANNHQSYLQGGTTATAAFTAQISTLHKINVSGATFTVTMPALTAAMDGQRIAIANIGTGTTATIVAPTGSDSVGNTTATGATAAGPTGGNTKMYCADFTARAWLIGV